MEQDHIVERCRAMSTRDLLRATTVDSSEYEPAFHAAAHIELSGRWLEVTNLRDRARLFLPDGSIQEAGLDSLEEALPEDLPEGTMVGVENCIDELLVFQRLRDEWVAHHSSGGDYSGSWICPLNETMRAVAMRFVRLEDWRHGLARDVPLSQWVVIESSCTMGFARRAMEVMHDTGIDARAVPNPSRSRCRGLCIEAPQYTIMVPRSDEGRARAVIEGFAEVIARLHADAERHAERGDVAGELTAYGEILTLAPDDHVALFNRGALLMDEKCYEEAFDCFVPLIGGQEDDIQEDIRVYLQDIIEAAPSIPVLHALAGIQRAQGDEGAARKSLEAALWMDEDNAMTHLALGYLCYEEGDRDATAVRHFRRYLETAPEADDRDAIQTILGELDGWSRPNQEATRGGTSAGNDAASR
ncbi:hypothetical protein JXA88_05180 [Candidatus Fermentibacteria bacterium]|nr:hypothetical protein [Candidatus Fermentibacteria bacterium]